MANTIYSVVGKTGDKMNKLEGKLFEFLTSDSFLKAVKIGDSLSEKKVKGQFAKWNKDKMTVNVNTLLAEKNVLKIAKVVATAIKEGSYTVDCIPVVHINKAHGNYSIDFVNVSEYDAYYSEKKATEKAKKTVFEFLESYLKKDSTKEAIENTDGKNDKIDAIISILEELKN